jgi:hypothetical protein
MIFLALSAELLLNQHYRAKPETSQSLSPARRLNLNRTDIYCGDAQDRFCIYNKEGGVRRRHLIRIFILVFLEAYHKL